MVEQTDLEVSDKCGWSSNHIIHGTRNCQSCALMATTEIAVFNPHFVQSSVFPEVFLFFQQFLHAKPNISPRIFSRWDLVSHKFQLIKFMFSEKATIFCEISTNYLMSSTQDKLLVEILQNFAKSPPIIWLAVHRTNNWWIFCKILWPS